MATIEPNNRLRLLKCPLTINNKNQITFENEPAQYNYFNNLPNLPIDEITYQRKNSIIRYPDNIDNLVNYNYCMYQNFNFGNKWFYAYIIGMRFVNPNMTEIQIATDCFQTWQFDLTWKPSFVEREMIIDDTIGKNTLPENLEIGEPIINWKSGSTDISNLFMRIIVGIADDKLVIGDRIWNFNGNNLNNLPNTLLYVLTDDINFLMNKLNNNEYGQKVFTAFTVPNFAIGRYIVEHHDDIYQEGEHYILPIIHDLEEIGQSNHLTSIPDNLAGYTPINNKLYCYPYNYLTLNFNGNSKLYRFENFADRNDIAFSFISELNPNPTCLCSPMNYRQYNQNNRNNLDAFVLKGYPILSTRTDYFNAWLAQNSQTLSLNLQSLTTNNMYDNLSNNMSQLSNIVGLGLNTVDGFLGLAGQTESNSMLPIASTEMGIMSGIGRSISNAGQMSLTKQRNNANYELNTKLALAQQTKQQLVPDIISTGSSGATYLAYSLYQNGFYTNFCIKPEYAKRIDDYFSMFGYSTNEVKIPNTNTRPNWNYVKTIGANILANIPQEDLEYIKSLFDNGITLWHNPDTYLDYSKTNK